MSADPEQQILSGSKRAAKSYGFLEQDPRAPAQWWFQEDPGGLVLFVVFYTQACRWSRCIGCNLPTMSALHRIETRDLAAQIDHLLHLPEVRSRASEVHKLIVSNNGSVLDEVTFSSTALLYLLARFNLELPSATVLTLETRTEYVDWDELAFINRALREREVETHLELAVGFEAFDDHVRNERFLKGLTLEKFEQLVQLMGPFGYWLKCYFMLKPVPLMTDEEAVADIVRAIDYLDEQATRHGVVINMHLNPTYAAHGTALAEAFAAGEYSPPMLRDVARAALHARDKRVSIFLGLYDEGLAVPGGSFIRPGDEAMVALLEQFNRTRDYELLARACEM